MKIRYMILLFALLAAGSVEAACNAGVVLLHGKESMPGNAQMQKLAEALRASGCLVAIPEMPWSRKRIYDATVEQTMVEITQAADSLKALGAKRIVIAGHSMGGNAAIRYAATNMPDAIVILAPGHQPEFLIKRLADDVARAQALISEGKGDSTQRFKDINVGHDLEVSTTPRIYLSWLDPEGSAVMPRNAAAIKRALPVFMAVGTRDSVARERSYIYDLVPAHPASEYHLLEADHIGLPAVATPALIAWLERL